MRAKSRELVFEFAKKSSKFKPLAIFLYGSVARGTEDKRSDVDLLVIFDTNKNPDLFKDRDDISKIALDLEKKYDKNIQLIFTNRYFDGVDQYFIHQILSEGIMLYGKPYVKLKETMFTSYSIFSYSLQNLDQRGKMKVRKELSGYHVEKHYKGKVYKSHDEGLLSALDGKRLGAGCIFIPQNNSKVIKDLFDKLKVKYKEDIVWLQME